MTINKKIKEIFKGYYNNYLTKKHYSSAQNLKEKDYENYLVDRYAEFMNRREYTKGKTLNLENPITFSEKSQWIKLYDQDPRKNIYSDKYAVRQHIKDTIGREHLIPLINIDGKDCFDSFDEIDFDKLPNSFVIKCVHGSHMNIIVKDKTKLTKKDIKQLKKKIKHWQNIDYCFYVALETQYLGIKPRIIVEEYVDDINKDYKFMCFNGKCEYFWISENVVDNKNVTYTTFNRDLSIADFNMNLGWRKNILDKNLPKNINEMILIADKLSEDFCFVRVDLYEIKGKIYFGELTFNSAAGFDVPYPAEYDVKLGNLMTIDLSKRENNFKYRKNENN